MINPEEFFELAKELYALGGEARFRSSINRAYYSAYLVACSKMAGGPPADANCHTRVSDYYVQRGKPLSSVGNRLKELFILRKLADYRPEKSIGSKESANALAMAGRIIGDLSGI